MCSVGWPSAAAGEVKGRTRTALWHGKQCCFALQNVTHMCTANNGRNNIKEKKPHSVFAFPH